MATISQTITALPEAGHRGVDGRATFVTKQEAFQDTLQGTTVPQLNNFVTQANAVRNEINWFQSTAATSATNASNSATAAATSATNAHNSATAAASARDAAINAFNNFDDRYLGNKASAPTVDNDGQALLEGALYWNSTEKRMKVYTGTAWQNTTNAVASTDNAIVRFDGITGVVQNSGVIIDDSGNLTITNGALRGSHGGGNVDKNTAVGDSALLNNTTGNYNTASGVDALLNNTTGNYNTASGVSALRVNTTGDNNTASGVSALRFNTTGTQNTASGVSALLNNTTGDNNTASGVSALRFNTTGIQNTASGVNALYNNTTGNYNTASGVSALLNNTTGNYNTASGVTALLNNTTFSNVSGFGYASQVTGSNQVQLGNSETITYVYGTVANRSDERDKADIRDTVLGLEFIQSLRPVDYKWDMREDYKTERPKEPEIEKPSESDEDYEAKLAEYESIQEAYKLEVDEWLESNKLANIVRDGSKKRTRYHQGFIAQEILALGVEFGGIQDHSIKGGDDVLSIGYDELIAPMVKAIQELKAEIEILKGVK